MKKIILKPGFEFIFALSLIAILGLPPVIMAQTQKDVEIKIENGDTTINGKNIKDLSATDKQEALKDIKHINGPGMHLQREFSFRRDTNNRVERIEFRRRNREGFMMKDSLGNVIGDKPGRFRNDGPDFAFNERMRGESPDNMGFENRRPERPTMGGMRRFAHKNSQNFDYVNTDEEGISTHISFHVAEASNDDLKRMPHVEGAKFEISDLNLVPEFSSGKTLLMFELPAKTVAEVKLNDSEGKIIFSEKVTGGTFSKSFSLGLNGIYYLQVKQGNSVAVKRILKEE